MHPFRFTKLIKICKSYPIISHKYQKLPQQCDSLRFCSVKSMSVGDDNQNSFSLFNTKKVLKASGLNFEDGFTSIKTECPVCDQGTSKREEIFINKTTGQFICPRCQHSCEWKNVAKFFTAKKSQTLDKLRKQFVDGKQVNNFEYLISDLVPLKNVSEEEITKNLNNLGIKNIPSNVFHSVETYFDEKSDCLVFPMHNLNGMVVGVKHLRQIGETATLTETTLPDMGSHGAIIFRPPHLKPKEMLTGIIVLSVLDLLALSTQKVNGTIICLPHGCKSLPQECLPLLEKFQKLILWFDYDTAGWDTAKNFSKKLDDKRCLFVRPTDVHPTPYLALQEGYDLKTILTKSQPILHKSITTFSALRQDVLSDLQNIDKVQGVKWKRYPSLNKYLKGHRKGELTVLTGPTGCGKTTFMSEYSLDLAMQGVNTLWGSFEIRNTRLASTLLRQMAGHPLDENLADFEFWADEFEKLPIYFMTFHGQQSIRIVMDAIDHAQYVHDIHHVIIDNVQFMMGMSEEPKHIDRFWKQDAIIAAFRTFATKKNCHVTLVIHPRKERDSEDLTTSSIFGSAKAAQEADNVLIIQDKRLTSVRGKKYLQIAKNRYSGDLGIMPMDFDKAGLTYAPKKKRDETTRTETSQLPPVPITQHLE